MWAHMRLARPRPVVNRSWQNRRVPPSFENAVPATDSRPGDRAWPELSWPPPPSICLRGDLVELRPADPAPDSAGLFCALDHDDVWRHVAGRPASPEAYASLLASRAAAGWLQWIVRLRQPVGGLPAGAIAGTSSYADVVVSDARLEIGSTAYSPALWGSVVNTDVKFELLSYAFEVLGAGRVQLKTDVRNVRSQRAIAAIGARYEGTLRRYQRRADGTIRDTALFAITAEDWPRVRAALIQRRQRRSG